MYVDDRPTSMFRQTEGWKMPKAPSGTLKQPPTVTADSASSSPSSRPRRPSERPPLPKFNSSSSSLIGFENSVPSFQDFIKRVPSVDKDKPLPDPPLRSRRSDGSVLESYLRRSSSIYSRTPSQWGSETSWKTDDLADSPGYLLQPIAYSTSTPDLTNQPVPVDSGELLEPRTFSPLIVSPSPTLSAVTGHESVDSRPHTMLSAPAISHTRSSSNRKPQTVSLEKAKQAMNAPGAVRLLPEEMRAKAFKNKGDNDKLRIESMQGFTAGPRSPESPILPPFLHQKLQNMASTRLTEIEQPVTSTPSSSSVRPALDDVPYKHSFPVGTGPVRNMAPPPVSDAYSSASTEEYRGRSTQRTSGRMALQPDPSPQDLVREYHSSLQEQQRRASESAGYSSDDSVRTHMKMVPQPLFQGKRPPKSINSRISSRGTESSSSPFSNHRRSSSASSTSRTSGFHLRLSLDQPTNSSDSMVSSTTGMIPISPPPPQSKSKSESKPSKYKPPRHHRPPNTTRESAFYPHIMQRKKSKVPKHPLPSSPELPPNTPVKPLLAADIIAQKLKTPAATPQTAPLAEEISTSATAPRRKVLFTRLASTIIPRRGSSSTTVKDEDQSPIPSPNSVHFGWSEAAKRDFDEARSPNVVHFAEDVEAEEEEAEAESPTSPLLRGSRVFGVVLESWREGKAQKRREDLKRRIRVVAPAEEEKPVAGEVKKGFGWV